MEFKIDNFRCFTNQSFDFSKINILIGENSSGKSSILKFLLALKQSLDNPFGINLKLFGDYVDLGNYDEIIYYHKNKKKISFSFTFPQDYSQFYFDFLMKPRKKLIRRSQYQLSTAKILKNIIKKYGHEPTTLTYTLNSNLENHHSIHTEIYNPKLGKLIIQHKKPSDSNPQNRFSVGEFPKCSLKFEHNNNRHTLRNIDFLKQSFMTIINSPSLGEYCQNKFSGTDFFYKIAYFLITQNYLEDMLNKIKFVNPIQSKPERFYSERDRASQYTNINLEKLINLFNDKSLPKDVKASLIRKINRALKFYGLANSIDIKLEKRVSVLELKARIKDLWSNITDVGYGVSLQLPILFQTIISNENGGDILLIEQPEVHLHPQLQSKFIETLIKIGNKNTYFIETHSEHIVRKLQVVVPPV